MQPLAQLDGTVNLALKAPTRSKLFLCHPLGALLPHGAAQLKRSLMQPDGWCWCCGCCTQAHIGERHSYHRATSGLLCHQARYGTLQSFCEGEGGTVAYCGTWMATEVVSMMTWGDSNQQVGLFGVAHGLHMGCSLGRLGPPREVPRTGGHGGCGGRVSRLGRGGGRENGICRPSKTQKSIPPTDSCSRPKSRRAYGPKSPSIKFK